MENLDEYGTISKKSCSEENTHFFDSQMENYLIKTEGYLLHKCKHATLL